jgi:lysophospholipid acyltransferase (LPLAT)-like uncharacterized protein
MDLGPRRLKRAKRKLMQAQEQLKEEITDKEAIARAFEFADLSFYPFKKRLLIRMADIAFYSIIRLIGSTIRYEVEGWKNWEAATLNHRQPIYSFWHNRVFASIYFWQKRGIVVMTSQSFDGEYIARFIQRFGAGAARGSSSRGGTTALTEMERLLRLGYPAAFTIDGPKGPRYVAKMGGVLLAKKSGQPMLPFTITPRHYWEAKRSWDRAQAPFPFTRARVDIAPPIFVTANADEKELVAKRDELQAVLDELDRRGLEWANR